MDNSSETQHNVVTMSDQKPHSGYAALSIVEAYWDALRAGREMPKRAEIDPRGIESALENTFILERVAPGVARLRIAGSHLHDIMGMEARGMPLTAFFEQDARIKVAGLLEEVFQTPATAHVTMRSGGNLGQPALEARMILLPLKSDLGDVSRILGCMVCLGQLGTVPRRFDLTNISVHRLGLAPLVEPQPDPVREEFSAPQMPFTPQPMSAAIDTEGSGKKRPPYLRLVKSDE
ncbi:PAS domain-containing protein [uncultured Sulfitobacter sp.]|uniref:PAS domain-containing protein n=1 Tax=uncultured Sulfitobacter sp. TaxID=191468 RepID=UPI002610079E|nr:PAS domain-containing protein [uncultured Sulfitobacter sp.]